MLVDHRVAQLLCSRLCHDLAGPAGAVTTGLELVEEGADEGGEAMDLVARSSKQVIARLNFFRIAFGTVGATSALTLGELRDLADGHLAGSLVKLDWPDDEGPAPSHRVGPPGAMLILSLVLLGVETLPRGGSLQLRFADLGADVGLAMSARGRGAALKPEQRDALMLEADVDALTARSVPAYCVGSITRDLGIAIEVGDGEADEVRFAAILPGG
jgi:histidine phosphotransferase ChpT